jgi:hypothetical protein
MDGADLIERHGLLLQAGRGPIPNVPELVVGGPIRGSWWAHPDHDEIFRVLNQAMVPGSVVRMRLVNGKITLVHRRLWPALVRLAARLGPDRLAVIEEEHTPSGSHRAISRPFPEWVPEDVVAAAAELDEGDAIAQLPACLHPA